MLYSISPHLDSTQVWVQNPHHNICGFHVMLQVTENLMGFVQHCRCLKPVWVSCYFDMDSSCLLVVCFVFYVTLVYCNVFYMFYSTVAMVYILQVHTGLAPHGAVHQSAWCQSCA